MGALLISQTNAELHRIIKYTYSLKGDLILLNNYTVHHVISVDVITYHLYGKEREYRKHMVIFSAVKA